MDTPAEIRINHVEKYSVELTKICTLMRDIAKSSPPAITVTSLDAVAYLFTTNLADLNRLQEQALWDPEAEESRKRIEEATIEDARQAFRILVTILHGEEVLRTGLPMEEIEGRPLSYFQYEAYKAPDASWTIHRATIQGLAGEDIAILSQIDYKIDGNEKLLCVITIDGKVVGSRYDEELRSRDLEEKCRDLLDLGDDNLELDNYLSGNFDDTDALDMYLLLLWNKYRLTHKEADIGRLISDLRKYALAARQQYIKKQGMSFELPTQEELAYCTSLLEQAA